ncbi:MAG: hypothetical protein D3908_14835, partial [Candidatus Electrothrix sp. AUS4]|nr:hypothetical protein [Candidatus Electrothrix sp. AUS4]
MLLSFLPYSACQVQGTGGNSAGITLDPFNKTIEKKLQVAKDKALSLIDGQFHNQGNVLLVPEEYKTKHQNA